MPDGAHPGPPHPPPRWSPAQPPSPGSALSSSTRPFRPEDPAPRTPQSALPAGRLPPPYRPTPPRPAEPPAPAPNGPADPEARPRSWTGSLSRWKEVRLPPATAPRGPSNGGSCGHRPVNVVPVNARPPAYRPTGCSGAAPRRDGILDSTYVTACNLAGQMKTLGLLREITTKQRLLTPKRNIKQRSILPTVLHTALPMSYSCLLYTSPSPRDRTRSRMPSSA